MVVRLGPTLRTASNRLLAVNSARPPSVKMVSSVTSTSKATKYQLSFYVPPANLEACKTAIFAAGAGCYPGSGNYTEACFTIIQGGVGQFRPGKDANPHIGTAGELETVQEARVETLCVGEDVVRRAVAALKEAHPYEEVAYQVFKMEDF